MNLNELTAQEVQEIARANPNNHNLYFYPSPSYPTGLIVVKYNEEHNLYNTTQYQAQTQTGSSLSVSLEALPAHFTYKLGNNPHALHWPNAVITINDEVIFSPEKTTADSDEAPQVKPIGNFWIVSGYIGAYWTEEDAQRALGLIKANMPLYDYATRHEGANGLTTRTEISRQEAEEIAALMGNTLEDLHKYGRIRYQLDAVLYATEIEAPQVLIVKGETERGVVELDGEEDAKEIIDLINLLAKQMNLSEYTVEIGPRAEIDSEIEIAQELPKIVGATDEDPAIIFANNAKEFYPDTAPVYFYVHIRTKTQHGSYTLTLAQWEEMKAREIKAGSIIRENGIAITKAR